MTTKEAIEKLEKMDAQIIHGSRIFKEIADVIREQDAQYRRLHSQVSGYLHGEQWEHWQKFNEPRFTSNEKS